MRHALLLFALLFLCSCTTTGPGAACDPCATEEVNSGADATAPFAQAAAASAKGGQEASNQPVQSDPGARGVFTPISRGAGSQTATNNTEETRSQAGAPSVNQGLVLPTAADARTGGGVSPVVASLQLYMDDLRAQLKLAMLDPTAPPDKAQKIIEAINAAISQMAQAQASSQAQVSNVYHLEGARIVQSVANGSNSGDGQTAIDPKAAEAIAVPTAAAVKATMAPSGDPSGVPPAGAPSNP
jgi:hypothetical protein